ncbi:662_t:CDS:2 [Diversispora eburnea]|uniref:662_t:CDS:1 n=1 Tax=Diversispora eburnea TaxID=1213867 RepID=A0A9N8VT55_9GLOM|nr:662_t:CDS:2 [Diversispora eburnea]
MSRLPKHSQVSTSGLPAPQSKRRTSSAAQKVILTPEQEALLQEALVKYHPDMATPATSNTQTNISPPRKSGMTFSRMVKPSLKSTMESPTTNTSDGRITSPNSNPSSPPSHISNSSPKLQRLSQIISPPLRAASPSLSRFSVGERVSVDSINITGTLKFMGLIDIKPGIWAGVEVDIPGTGKNNGDINGVSYFTCAPKSGIFILASKLSKPIATESSQSKAAPPVSAPSTNALNAAAAASRITEGSLASKYVGVTASQLKQRTLVKPAKIITSPTILNPNKQNRRLARPDSNINPPQRQLRSDSLSSNGSSASNPSTFYNRTGIHRSRSSTPNLPPRSLTPSDNETSNSSIYRKTGVPRSRSPTPNPQPRSLTPSDTETSVSTPTAHGEMVNSSLQTKIQNILNNSGSTEGIPPNLIEMQALRIQELQKKIEVLEAENKLNNQKAIGLSEATEKWEAEKESIEKSSNEKIALLNKQIEQLTSQVEDSKVTIEQSQKTIEDKLAEISELNEKLKETQKNFDQIKKELDETNESVSELRNAGKEAIQIYETKVSTLEKQNESLKKAGRSSLSLVEESNSKLRQRDSIIKMLRKDKDELIAAGSEAIVVYEKMLEKQESEAKATLHKQEEIYENLSKEKTSTQQLYEEAEKKLKVVDEQLKAKDRAIKGLGEELAGMQFGVEELMRNDAHSRERISQLEEEIRESNVFISRQKEEISALKTNLSNLMSNTDETEFEKVKNVYESDINRLESEKEALQKSLSDAQAEKRSAASELDDMITKNKNLEKSIQDLKDEKVKTNSEFEETNKKIEELKLSIDKKSQIVNDAEMEKMALLSSRDNIKKELSQVQDQAKQDVDKLKSQIEVLQSQIETLQSQAASTDDIGIQLETKVLEYERLNLEFVEFKEEVTKIRSENEELKNKQQINELRANVNEVDNKEYEKKIEAFKQQITELQTNVNEVTNENLKLTDENKKTIVDYEKLIEAHKQVENECMKLMEELEILHSEQLGRNDFAPLSPPAEANDKVNVIISDDATTTNADGPEISRLQTLLSDKQKQIDRLTSTHKSETKELRLKLHELEKEKQKEIKTLHREVSELESLIESKIFREADLEEQVEMKRISIEKLTAELEYAQEQLNEMKKFDKDLGFDLSYESSKKETSPSSKIYCELCDEEGHDLMSCKSVFDQGSNKNNVNKDQTNEINVSDSHCTKDCPNQDETF